MIVTSHPQCVQMRQVKTEKDEEASGKSEEPSNFAKLTINEDAGKGGGKSASRYTKRPPNERKFKCDECDRKFFTRKDVKRHMVVHTGIRNFACPFCQQRFGRKDHLVRHAKKSHNRDTRVSSNYRVNSSVSRRGSSLPRPTAASLGPVSLQSRVITSPPHGETVSHSPCSYSNAGSPHEQPSLLLLGSNNGHNSTSSVCYNPNNSVSAGGMPVSLGEGNYPSTSMHAMEEAKHGCESSLFSNGTQHYFTFPMTGPPTFMGPTYISNCFVPSPGGSNAVCTTSPASNSVHHPVHSVHAVHHHHHHPSGPPPPPPNCPEHSPVALQPSFSAHDLSSSLPHFNQIFQ